MLLSPVLGLQLRPKLNCWIKRCRNTRPNIKIGKTKFHLELDVKNFNKDEIRVKTRSDYVIIEGKKEQKTKRGFIMRQFMRKFKLPPGCMTECMESKLSNDGVLTITAPRKICEDSYPCETLIPISHTVLQEEKQTSNKPVENKPVSDSKDTPPTTPSDSKKS